MNGRRSSSRPRRGSILILVLWVVIFLSMFAARIGLRLRQRIHLLAGLEGRSQQRYLAEAGVKLALATLRRDLRQNQYIYTPEAKKARHNDPDVFKNIVLGEGAARVLYRQGRLWYGLVDEERKLNLNVISQGILARLLRQVAGVDAQTASRLALSVLEWRQPGKQTLEGFYSDEYYTNLKHPYQPKGAPFEVLEELRLVRGFTEDIYQKIFPFVTVYGDGRININTAPAPVLLALGLEAELVDKILSVRRGPDGFENTPDDYIFYKPFDIGSEIKGFMPVTIDEMRQIDRLNQAGILKTDSDVFRVESEGLLRQRVPFRVVCVYNFIEDRVVYWVEE